MEAYVSTSGSDKKGKVGDMTKPFRTISEALRASNNVVVLPGIYTESITITGKAKPVKVPNSPVQDIKGDITTIVIRGASGYNTRIDLTSPIRCDKVSLKLKNLTVAAVNMSAIEASDSFLDISECYIQSTYNSKASTGTNYVVHTVNTFTRFQAALILLTEPTNPADLVMFYAEGNTSLIEYTRFIHNALEIHGHNIPTKLDIVGGSGNFILSFTELLLEAPGNVQFNNINMIDLTGPTTLSMDNNTFTTFTPNTPIPAGKSFSLISEQGTKSNISVVNQTMIGLRRFENVNTTLPQGSYRNISWDIEQLPTIGFSVSKSGGVRLSSMSTQVTKASGTYHTKESDYLITGADDVHLTPSAIGRMIVVANTGTGVTVIHGKIVSSYSVHGVVALKASETATFQYDGQVWIQTSSTQKRDTNRLW